MAHEIEEEDNVILHKEQAWHGLGIVVKEDMTPRQALALGGLDRTVVCRLLTTKLPNGEEIEIPDKRVTMYENSKKVLGFVGDKYKPIQNIEVADFCEKLASNGDTVKIESCGTIRNGAKIWFLLKGESFSVRASEDEIKPYICVSNGHDGMTALRCTPTTVRVVCSNTLHMVIPKKEENWSRGFNRAAFSCYHNGENITDKIKEAQEALGLYQASLKQTKAVITALSSRDVNKAEIEDFFLKCYTTDFGPIPVNPETEEEEEIEWKAKKACKAVFKLFEKEAPISGTTLWNAFNAYTGWDQNENQINIKDPSKRWEARASSKLFGVGANRAHTAIVVAAKMAS